MKRMIKLFWIVFLTFSGSVLAAADLEVSTPAISAVKSTMQTRHNNQLVVYYASGAIGLTRDGNVAMHDANKVPLAERKNANEALSDENRDRAALYREIARANGHPEWEAEVRATFAQRWINKAASGWWVQKADGEWVKK